MQIEPKTFPAHEPDQNVLHKAYFAEQICLALVVQFALINLFSQVFPVVDRLLPAAMLHMRFSSVLFVLGATLALFLTEGKKHRKAYRAGKFLAGVSTISAMLALWAPIRHGLAQFDQFSSHGHVSQDDINVVALSCMLLGLVKLFLRSRNSIFGSIADAGATLLSLIVLVILVEYGFAAAKVPGADNGSLLSLPTLACLTLLTLISILRRAEYGVFAEFLGDGIGGRIARIVAPILLFLPFLRELVRARLVSSRFIPLHYSSAFLTAVATLFSFALLLVVVRLINRMQTEIQGLTLRDELTGLYNFRGFHLFAEQAFRLARRAGMPFGVLFVDMDNLKIINDELGHHAGSVSLVETAKLLVATCRETDVIGRLGGDEFVVAGQFDPDEISAIIDRIRSAAASKTQLAENRFFLSLSMGYAASDFSENESLRTIIARADKVMYKEKRAKKRIA